MKKLFLTAILAVACVFSATAQENVLSKGTSIASLGVGFTTVSHGKLTFPPVAVMYEYGVADFGRPGSIGVGAYVGMYGSHYNDFYKYSYFYTPIGVRGAYHFTIKNNWEVYGGAVLGAEITSSSWKVDSVKSSDTSVGFMYSIFAGTRYMFTDSIGAFLELGYGIAYATVGISFKF